MKTPNRTFDAPGWAVLLWGSPPNIHRIAEQLEGSEARIFEHRGHLFLQAADFNSVGGWPYEVAWAAAAVAQQLTEAARLRLGDVYPIHTGGAVLIDSDGKWDQRALAAAISEAKNRPRPLAGSVPLDQLRKIARARPHLAHALGAFARGSAAWSLREAFEEIERDLGHHTEKWIQAHDWFPPDYCAWFRSTVSNSSRRWLRPSRSSRVPRPPGREHMMTPLEATVFVHDLLERLIAFYAHTGGKPS